VRANGDCSRHARGCHEAPVAGCAERRRWAGGGARGRRGTSAGVSGTRAMRAEAVRQEWWPSRTTTCKRACADAGPAARCGMVCASLTVELAVRERASTLMRKCRRGCRRWRRGGAQGSRCRGAVTQRGPARGKQLSRARGTLETAEEEATERRQWSGVTSSEEMRCSQARRAPFIYTEVKAGATRHGFDVQRKTGGGGRSNQRALQQVEGTAKLQDPED
jgi:hypothetical protein